MVLKPDVVMGQNSKYIDFRRVVSASTVQVNCSMKEASDGARGMRKPGK